jgi:Polyketide cyclase / dehydrase and lipid transport
VKNYKSTLSVKAAGEGSTLTWQGMFDANGASDADAIKTITGVYEAGAGELAKAK